ncbi:Ribose 5-phosphate isomerase B [Bacillus badius]|nr:Ribose 5-phosphate isomerase B [Bacillus badius]
MIGTEGAQIPAGAAGQVRPRRRFCAEEAHRPPRGKRSAWSEKQPSPHANKINNRADVSFSSLITAG